MWREHGAWVTQHNPTFGPGIKERFAMAKAITPQQVFMCAHTYIWHIDMCIMSIFVNMCTCSICVCGPGSKARVAMAKAITP